MNKLAEFLGQLYDVECKLEEYEELRNSLHIRINELQEEKVKANGIFLTNNQLHKLLCYLDNTVIDEDGIKNKLDRENLYDFRDELQWQIADKFEYDLNEGTIDPKTYEFYTYKSMI